VFPYQYDVAAAPVRCSSYGAAAKRRWWPIMRALVFERCGEPAEALELREVPVPEPRTGEVRVRMRASPINPSDLMTVRGQYGRLPALPATPGFEGVGVIDAVGRGWLARLRGLRPGRRVAVLNSGGGNWQEQVVIPARNAVPVPDDLPDEQVASFFVNPASALVMTQDVLRVPPGAWLLQTAAASALGRMVIRLGRHTGFRTINVVRRRDVVAELPQLGADEVLCSADEDVVQRVQQITGGAGVPFALDPVGGTTALDAVRSLGPGGRLLLYGTLSGEPVPLDPRVLIGGQKRIEGFWLSEWALGQRVLTMLRLFRRLVKLLRADILTTPLGTTYPMAEYCTAVRAAEQPGRKGKILLRLS
jgi:NADPH:quinone reductase-like Zn-dependent oxidoreductase